MSEFPNSEVVRFLVSFTVDDETTLDHSGDEAPKSKVAMPASFHTEAYCKKCNVEGKDQRCDHSACEDTPLPAVELAPELVILQEFVRRLHP